jgi:hypothetical protein
MNKYKPKVIPGFSSAKQLESKRQFETVVVGRQETNKLILPAGYEGIERANRVMVVESDLLLG